MLKRLPRVLAQLVLLAVEQGLDSFALAATTRLVQRPILLSFLAVHVLFERDAASLHEDLLGVNEALVFESKIRLFGFTVLVFLWLHNTLLVLEAGQALMECA